MATKKTKTKGSDLAKDLTAIINYKSEPAPEPASSSDAGRFGLSESYWASLTDKSRELMLLVRPLPTGESHTVHLGHLEHWIADQQETATRMGGTFDLCPDFQRGHVWTPEQQRLYIENFLRGVAPRELRFNSPAYSRRRDGGDINPYDFVCVDGLQRLTAMRRFLSGDLTVFGEANLRAEDLRGTPFDPFRMTLYFTMTVFSLNRRADLLSMYLDINSGGSVHTSEELTRVRGLLDAEKARVKTA